MKIRPALLILAAGMGSRYGGLKQLDTFGPNNETIIDYSVYDAIKAGFGKVVFVIRKSIEQEFKNIILPRFENKIDVDYVLQELGVLPEGFNVPENREKPWGTGHAVWTASSKIDEPFAVINADDFYGFRSFQLIAGFLMGKKNEERHFAVVGYQIGNTLSEHGSVSRGVCEINEDFSLGSLTEQTDIIKTKDGISVQHAANVELLTGNELVSMNLMGFTPSVFTLFEKYLKEFLKSESFTNLRSEFYLPEVVNKSIREGEAKVKVLPSPEKWFGVTYPDDKATAIENIENLIAAGAYPENLWQSTGEQDNQPYVKKH